MIKALAASVTMAEADTNKTPLDVMNSRLNCEEIDKQELKAKFMEMTDNDLHRIIERCPKGLMFDADDQGSLFRTQQRHAKLELERRKKTSRSWRTQVNLNLQAAKVTRPFALGDSPHGGTLVQSQPIHLRSLL